MKMLLFGLAFFLIDLTASGQSAVFVASIANPSRDTVNVVVEDNDVIWKSDSYHLPIQNKRYQVRIPVSKPSFFYLKEGSHYVHGLIEPGDSIFIQYDGTKKNETLSFAGSKKEANTLYNQFIQFGLRDQLKAQLPVAKQKPYPFDHLFYFLDSLEHLYLEKLNKLKHELSGEALEALTGYIKAQFLFNRYNSVTFVYHESPEQTIANRPTELTAYSLRQIESLRQFDENYYGVSAYVNSVYKVLFLHYDGLLLEGKADKNLAKKFAYLNSQLPPKLRAPVLTMFIEYEMGVTNDAAEIQAIIKNYFTNAADEVYNSYVISKFDNLAALKKGLPAPDFTLDDEKGQKITLDALKGKVIYMDFWFASCGPCHVLFEKLKPVKEHFRKHPEVVFLNVSIDPETLWKASLKKFAIEGYHVFTQNKGSHHSIIKDYKVGQYPTTFLIDKNGRVYNAKPPDDPDELITQIEQMLQQ